MIMMIFIIIINRLIYITGVGWISQILAVERISACDHRVGLLVQPAGLALVLLVFGHTSLL